MPPSPSSPRGNSNPSPTLCQAAKSDIYDRQGTTHEGIHCAVMAGTIDIIVSNFVGLRERNDGSYCIRPTLPKHWQSVTLKRLMQGHWYTPRSMVRTDAQWGGGVALFRGTFVSSGANCRPPSRGLG